MARPAWTDRQKMHTATGRCTSKAASTNAGFVLGRVLQWLLAAAVGQNIMMAKRFQLSQKVYGSPRSGAAQVLLCLDGLGDVIRTLSFSFKAAPVALDAAIGHRHQVLGNENSTSVCCMWCHTTCARLKGLSPKMLYDHLPFSACPGRKSTCLTSIQADHVPTHD